MSKLSERQFHGVCVIKGWMNNIHSSIWIAMLPAFTAVFHPNWSKTCKKWVMTLSSSMAMYSVMRDIPDARKVPMERGWVALYLYATCKFSNLLTLEQWAFEYGLPLFWYALYSHKRVLSAFDFGRTTHARKDSDIRTFLAETRIQFFPSAV